MKDGQVIYDENIEENSLEGQLFHDSVADFVRSVVYTPSTWSVAQSLESPLFSHEIDP